MHSEVMIVGAGPVGLALANLLGRYGREVTLLESRSELIDYPRGVGLDDESMRSIQTMGLVEQVEPFTIPHHVMRLVNGRGETMVTNAPRGEPFGWPRKFGFIQPLVDRELYEGLDRFGSVRVLFNHTVTESVDRGDHVAVTATITQPDGSTREQTFTADYVVGCEGGSSPTRKRMDVEFVGESPSTRWVVIDVNNDPLGTPNVYLGADPARPYVSIGLPHGIRRWEFMLFDGEDSALVEDDDFVTALLAGHVPDSSTLEVIRRRVFTHHARIATSFRQGRILVAGDAAHLMPVWMGQGWNSGMRDATNLAWKLASVLDGQADESLLDTYDVERRDHAKAMIDLSMTFGSIIKPTNRVVCAVRDTVSRAMNLSPRVKSYFADMRFKPMPFYAKGVVVAPDSMQPGEQERQRTSRFMTVRNAVDKTTPVGRQFIQPRVNTHKHTGARLDDVIGAWWTVAAWGNDPARHFTQEERRQLEQMGARFVSFMSESQRPWAEREYAGSGTLIVGDTDGSLKGWFDRSAMGVVFLRPDRFVAAASLAQDAGRALAALQVAMGATVPPVAEVGGRPRPTRKGDTFVVTKLDRLGRSVPDLRDITRDLHERGVALQMAGATYDPADPFGKFFLTTLAAVAEFEADMISLRTKEGLAVARAKGRLNGKPPKLSKRQHLKVLAEYESGEVTVGELAEDYGVNRATIYRTVARAKAMTNEPGRASQ